MRQALLYLQVTLIGFCFVTSRFNENETGYSVTAYCLKNYYFSPAPPRKGKLSGAVIAWYLLVLMVTLASLMFFLVESPKTADLAREYKRMEKSVFAERVNIGEVVQKNADFLSLREGVLRDDLMTNYRPAETESVYGVVPIMRSHADLDPEVRIWFVCSPAWHTINHPLQFRVLSLFFGVFFLGV